MPRIVELIRRWRQRGPQGAAALLRSPARQLREWRRCERTMRWGISAAELNAVGCPPPLTLEDKQQGFIGSILCYGFGDDGKGNADPVLSGAIAWEYAKRCRGARLWQCQYIHFDRPDYFRLRPEAPPRPRGFYYAKLNLGEEHQRLSVAQFRRTLRQYCGCGPEGLQFLLVTNQHFQRLMDRGQAPFIALADYEVAPYGFRDYFDAPHLFCRDGIVGLGIGNIDGNYPNFAIPAIALP